MRIKIRVLKFGFDFTRFGLRVPAVLVTPRASSDDPLKGVAAQVSSTSYPNASAPSRLDKLNAARVAALPLRPSRASMRGPRRHRRWPPAANRAFSSATAVQPGVSISSASADDASCCLDRKMGVAAVCSLDSCECAAYVY